MQRTRTALAATLDFRESSTAAAVTDRRGPLTADYPRVPRRPRACAVRGPDERRIRAFRESAALTLAPRSAARDGSQKYHELDLRRRRAQIRARRTLGLL